jgi:PAS domain S-box-containing protein
MPDRTRSGPARAPLRQLVNAGFVAGVLVLGGLGWLSYWTTARYGEASAQRQHSYEVGAGLELLIQHVDDAETGQRGFLLTGDEPYLEPFVSGSAHVMDDISELDQVLADDPAMAARFDNVRRLTTARMALLNRQIALRRSRGLSAALASVRTGLGKRMMDSLRAVVAVMTAKETEQAARSDARVTTAARFARLAIGGGGVIAVSLGVVALFLVNRGLTAREGAEAAVRESESRLFQVLDAMPVAVFVVDAAGRPYYANQVSADILGKGALLGAEPGDIAETYQAYVAGTDQLYPTERLPVMRGLAGERARITDLEIHRPDRVVPVEIWSAPVYTDGRITFGIAAFSDVTERREAERHITALNAQLAHQVTELETVNRELESFSFSVSHDLRSPLRAVDGFARILETDYAPALDSEARRVIGVIRQNAQRMGLLIDDLLRLSRLGRQDLVAGRVDLEAMARAVVREITPEGSTADVRVATLPAVRADASLVRQVWINLVGNALKYSRTRDHPVVEIGVHANGKGEPVVCYVRDNGVGFDPAHAGKLFGVFQRLHRDDEFEGTGVGLAIVQRIVHRHGGRVWAESAPDRGATFFFSLPAAG